MTPLDYICKILKIELLGTYILLAGISICFQLCLPNLLENKKKIL